MDELAVEADPQRRQRHHDRRLPGPRKMKSDVFEQVLHSPVQPVVPRIEMLTEGIGRLRRRLAQLPNRSGRGAHSLGILSHRTRHNRREGEQGTQDFHAKIHHVRPL